VLRSHEGTGCAVMILIMLALYAAVMFLAWWLW